VAWLIRILPAPILLIILAFTPLPVLTSELLLLVIAVGIVGAVVTVAYMKAIKISPLSLSLPMLTFTPVFMLLTSPLILGEFPTWTGVAGIICIVAGAYLLNIRDARRGYLAPIKSLFREKGPVIMLCIALVWSIMANVDKIGIMKSSVIFWSASFYTAVAIFLFPVVLLKSKGGLGSIRKNLKFVPAMGIVPAARVLFQMTAITMTIVPYVISIKRTSAFFGSLYGRFFFGERGFRERIAGVLVMITGVILIALF